MATEKYKTVFVGKPVMLDNVGFLEICVNVAFTGTL
jgi:hypothetical protein